MKNLFKILILFLCLFVQVKEAFAAKNSDPTDDTQDFDKLSAEIDAVRSKAVPEDSSSDSTEKAKALTEAIKWAAEKYPSKQEPIMCWEVRTDGAFGSFNPQKPMYYFCFEGAIKIEQIVCTSSGNLINLYEIWDAHDPLIQETFEFIDEHQCRYRPK